MLTATLAELRDLDANHAQRIANLGVQLDDYWQTFDPLFDWTVGREDLPQRRRSSGARSCRGARRCWPSRRRSRS